MRDIIEMARILLERIAREISIVDNSPPYHAGILQRQQDTQQRSLRKAQLTMDIVQADAAGSLHDLQDLYRARDRPYCLDPRPRHAGLPPPDKIVHHIRTAMPLMLKRCNARVL